MAEKLKIMKMAVTNYIYIRFGCKKQYGNLECGKKYFEQSSISWTAGNG